MSLAENDNVVKAFPSDRTDLLSYMQYYNGARTHLSLNKDAPVPRTVQTVGRILPTSILGGLLHQYVRIEFPTGTTFPSRILLGICRVA